MVDQYYGGRDDTLVCDLLRAQRAPPKWFVYRVLHYTPHAFNAVALIGKTEPVCSHCPLPRHMHEKKRDLRILLLLTNGPLRRLTWKTDQDDELPAAVRNWLHTLFNLAGAVNMCIDDWAAYDGRSDE